MKRSITQKINMITNWHTPTKAFVNISFFVHFPAELGLSCVEGCGN